MAHASEYDCRLDCSNRDATDDLLWRLREHHCYDVSERRRDLEIVPIKETKQPPIPNKALVLAHHLLPQEGFAKVEMISRAVLTFYPDITMIDLKSTRRTKGVVLPRQIAMYLAKTLTTRSLPDIGRRFGNRDHTTVLHAVRKIAALIGIDPEITSQVGCVKEMFAGEET